MMDVEEGGSNFVSSHSIILKTVCSFVDRSVKLELGLYCEGGVLLAQDHLGTCTQPYFIACTRSC